MPDATLGVRMNAVVQGEVNHLLPLPLELLARSAHHDSDALHHLEPFARTAEKHDSFTSLDARHDRRHQVLGAVDGEVVKPFHYNSPFVRLDVGLLVGYLMA